MSHDQAQWLLILPRPGISLNMERHQIKTGLPHGPSLWKVVTMVSTRKPLSHKSLSPSLKSDLRTSEKAPSTWPTMQL